MNLAYLQKIGRGSSADVWCAEDLDLKRKVAVKFFNDTDPAVHRKTALEHARALARVQHPCVVTVFGSELQKHPDSERDCVAIIMEYVEGDALSLFSERFSIAEALKLISDIAEAVEAIHAAGMIHDDLHEANVMVTPRGAKVLDILYTRTLAEVGARTAQGDRQSDIRSYAKLARYILERTDGVDPEGLVTAHYRADRAPSARAALEEFRACLAMRALAKRDPSPFTQERLYLVWVASPNRRYWPQTRVYSTLDDATFSQRGTLPDPWHATSTRLWTLRAGNRPLRMLSGSVLERWQEDGFTYQPSPADYVPATIADATFTGLPDSLQVPLTTSNPAPLSAEDYFQFERGIYVLGALGPYVFAEQHDYVFGGGVHGGVNGTFRLIDLEASRDFDNAIQLFSPDEHSTVQRCAILAAQAFRAYRQEEGIYEDLEVELVSARPTLDPYGEGNFDLSLKYSTATSYASSDHQWTSYTLSEEVSLRSSPSSLALHAALPRKLFETLAGDAALAVGWSRVPPEHPARKLLLRELQDVLSDAAAAV